MNGFILNPWNCKPAVKKQGIHSTWRQLWTAYPPDSALVETNACLVHQCMIQVHSLCCFICVLVPISTLPLFSVQSPMYLRPKNILLNERMTASAHTHGFFVLHLMATWLILANIQPLNLIEALLDLRLISTWIYTTFSNQKISIGFCNGLSLECYIANILASIT